MADIDDFLKKRDKKKKTTQKAKFSTLDTEEFAKQLEATTTVTDGLGAESENVVESGGVEVVSTAAAGVINHHPANHTGGAGNGENQDEEWKPFDSEDNKDYSGLRINQNWKLEDEEDLDEDGENDESEKKVAFSWGKKKQQQEAPPQDDEEEKTDEAPQSSSSATPAAVSAAPLSNDSKQSAETAESTETSATTTASSEPAPGAYIPPFLRKKMEEAKAAGAGASASSSSSTTTATPAAAASTSTSAAALPGAYVPPHLRNRGGGGDSGPSSSSSSSGASSGGALTGSVPTRRNRVQPNINDTLEFPTLATAIETPETSEKSSTGNEESFVQSKKGARVEAKSNKPMIDLENKFMALETSNN